MRQQAKRPEQPTTPGKRRPGQRGKTRHGGFSFLTTGQLPRDRLYLKPYLIATREALIHDHAAREEDLPAAKRILIDQVITNLGAVRLIQEYVRECGVFQHASALLQPALSTHYLSWLNRISKDLALLGIERRPREEEAINALDYIREFDKEQAKDAELEKKAGPKKPAARRAIMAGRGTAQPSAAKAALEAHVEIKDPGQATAAADAAAVPEDDQDQGQGPAGGDA